MNLTDEELKARLENPENLLNLLPTKPPLVIPTVEIVELNVPRKTNGKTTPEIKEIIAEVAETHTIAETAAITGYSEATVAKVKKDPSIREKLDRKAEAVEDRAIDATLSALNSLLTPDKMVDLKAKELSIIASNVASVVSKVRKPTVGPDGAVSVKVAIYTPSIKSERDYESFEVEGKVE